MTVKDLSMAAWPFWLKRLTVFLTTHPPQRFPFLLASMRLAAFNAVCAFSCPACAYARSMGMLPESQFEL